MLVLGKINTQVAGKLGIDRKKKRKKKRSFNTACSKHSLTATGWKCTSRPRGGERNVPKMLVDQCCRPRRAYDGFKCMDNNNNRH